ncbi:type VI secretion system secreted protein VgrG [Cupriavidus sp. OV038]|uniref:type VI secretion system Vgr family protein n=2 Tax=Pseudomonadota TaxID=1224 RepID=UPI0008EE98F5|nr:MULTISPECIES: type VI secretion system Vgr family protein [unclassified Cupriavidus]SFD09718.1 type VI secretion system secreted protein VgrG [Cupriavidus sp. OV038]SFP75402.1 type VI secretion system secreted protein VgrG [Cupriavidus sp. OV096]
MADLGEELKAYGGALDEGLTGRQAYFLAVPGAASAAGLSVVSFKAVERLGEPYAVTIQLTHPLELSQADYLGKAATFSIAPADGALPRQFAGCITQFSKTRQTHDFCGYEIVVEPLVARLRLTQASRIYQRQTFPEIIEAILRRHELKGHQFIFRLRRKYPQLAFRMQYRMSDWDYIRLLMEQSGIYSYFTPGKFGEMIVFGDDIDHYLYQPELRVPYRETAGLESGQETVFALKTHAKTIPASFRVADFNPDKAWERPTGDANVARKEKTTYGESYVYGAHHLDFDDAKWEAQLRHEAKVAEQLVYAGESNVLALCPARILRMDMALPDAPNGQVITEVIHTGARDAAYRNTYRAIPSDRRFRLPMDEAKWPRISGTLSARVTSPGEYKYAYLTQHGHYIVRFDFDFDAWPKGGESVPLALAKPFAGARQTGFHFPLVDGTYVDVAFRDGNPNKPYIAHVQHNSQHGDVITNQDRWLSRNVIRTQSNNKLRFEDWEGQEGIKLSTEYAGKSQLNLGCLVDSKRKKRGEGFELRTSGWGAIRGGKGLFLTADDQPRAGGKQLAMEAAKAVLADALAQMEHLNASAAAAKVRLADVERQRDLMEQRLAELSQAVLLASAPAGIALASGESLQLAAKGNIVATTRTHLDIGAGKYVTIAAGEGASIFAQNQGIKLVAAKADLSAAAHTGQMRLLSAQDMTLASVDGKFVAMSGGALTLSSQGAYIKLDGGNIELGCPGSITLKTANFTWQGPASLNPSMPALPVGACKECLLSAHAGVEAMTDKG